MRFSEVASRILRVAALAAALFVIKAGSFALLGPEVPAPGPEAEDAAAAGAVAMLAVCALEAAVLVPVAARLAGGGVAAGLALFALYFGAGGLMSQIESIFFISAMPARDALRVMAAQAATAALAVPLALWLLRRERAAARVAPAAQVAPEGPLHALGAGWLPRLAAIALLYLTLYFVFGYAVAWVRPEVREFYGGGPLLPFTAHLAALARDQPTLFLFQVLRALLWTALAVPALGLFRGSTTAAGLAVGLGFAVFMTAQLLLPNPYMPEAVRHIHLVETASSNLIFGFALAWILRRSGAIGEPGAEAA